MQTVNTSLLKHTCVIVHAVTWTGSENKYGGQMYIIVVWLSLIIIIDFGDTAHSRNLSYNSMC